MKNYEPYDLLTNEQLRTVQDFAAHNGRYWKDRLRSYWLTQGYLATSPTTTPILQGLRNTHGPRWLAGFRLPKVEG